ncbi:sensor histidine kinase [Raineyella sp. LH-20]|uniref:sensor histidine kinase n=1 Tax=Raineyella sp. LH-20 TaxID=3081204 RepID=UPI002952AEB6|nr:histidine kinase [Raineyella sp. LH-20]WOP17791.1 histidine kinase [Raineyella sp. LH-20]
MLSRSEPSATLAADLRRAVPWTVVGRVAWTVLGGLVGILACLVALVGSLSVVPGYQTSADVGGQLTGLGALVLLAWLLAMFTIFVRRSQPWVPAAAGVVLAVGLQLDSLLLLLGGAAVVLHRDRRQGVIASVVAGAITLVAGLRDGLRPWGHTAWVFALGSDPLAAPDRGLQLGVSVGIAVGAGAVVLGTAWLIRSRRDLGATRRDLGATEQARAVAEDRSEQLETTAVRLAERERLAREVHDSLAHRLSLISLHAGALEEAAQDSDPSVADSAEALRDSAHRSLEDLRDLVSTLREPPASGRPAVAGDPAPVPPIGLAALPELVDSARASGVCIEATIMVQDADEATDLLNRAAYRIVQEALTNAVKHAPGQPVRMELTAGPTIGVHLAVRNPQGLDAGLPGSGSGLIGMQERAALLGGILTAEPDGRGEFVVEASLPWQTDRAPDRLGQPG